VLTPKLPSFGEADKTYKSNQANRTTYIQPDHYLEDGNNQDIIDAKVL
jgi:hypothetical protein